MALAANKKAIISIKSNVIRDRKGGQAHDKGDNYEVIYRDNQLRLYIQQISQIDESKIAVLLSEN